MAWILLLNVLLQAMPTASMDGCALFVNDIDLPVLPRDHLRPPATTRGAHTRGARVYARRRPVFRSASCCYYLVMVASHMAAGAAVVFDFWQWPAPVSARHPAFGSCRWALGPNLEQARPLRPQTSAPSAGCVGPANLLIFDHDLSTKKGDDELILRLGAPSTRTEYY